MTGCMVRGPRGLRCGRPVTRAGLCATCDAALQRLSIAGGPQLQAVLDCARRVAWTTHANVMGVPYLERRQALAQLRGALHAWDGIEYVPMRTRS